MTNAGKLVSFGYSVLTTFSLNEKIGGRNIVAEGAAEVTYVVDDAREESEKNVGMVSFALTVDGVEASEDVTSWLEERFIDCLISEIDNETVCLDFPEDKLSHVFETDEDEQYFIEMLSESLIAA